MKKTIREWNKNRLARRKLKGKSSPRLRESRRTFTEGIRKLLSRLAGKDHSSAHRSLLRYHQPGPCFEKELIGDELVARQSRARAFAFYLPQFYPFKENDEWWGSGFTEWRNVTRAVPRFEGHVQPRLPRDLGFYDLRNVETIREQVRMAEASGIAGFCFYYYWFDGKRLLDKPLDAFLEDRQTRFPFCLMWANENWTRRWDGMEHDILMKQSYQPEHDALLIDDLARYFKDPRYERIDGRPLFILYRPNIVPDFKEQLLRWRTLFRERHALDPVILMVQGFGDQDPVQYGLDGAIEFPPHKVAEGLPQVTQLELNAPDFTGTYFRYDDLINSSLAAPQPPFELIRTAVPSWDNEARKPGRGYGFIDADPEKYEGWLRALVQQASARPFMGKVPYVFVNAWNEWAEGAVLEPDLYHGSAYLNATFRAVTGLAKQRRPGQGILLVGHDASAHGAQLLMLHIMKTLKERFGMKPALLLLKGGPLLSQYRACGEVRVLGEERQSPQRVIQELASGMSVRSAICNTTVTGQLTRILHQQGFRIVSLVHELESLIRSEKLEDHARQIGKHAEHVVFPAPQVQRSFEKYSRPLGRKARILPQGIYQPVSPCPELRPRLREKIGAGSASRIVLNIGYGDLRKGFDLFVQVARKSLERGEDLHFVWLGDLHIDLRHWLSIDLQTPPLAGRLHVLPFDKDVAAYLNGADVLALTSREDPFPSTVLEALACGIPVVAFDGGGGYVSAISEIPHGGELVPLGDVDAMADAIRRWIQTADPQKAAERAQAASEKYDWGNYVFSLLELALPGLKRVSVVVPNYNYGKYLATRLDSIFSQDYPIYELILLDDCSSDDSIAVARAFSEKAGRRIRIVPNEKNSNSVFRQWEKGVRLARGEVIWIAEADDSCTPSFLSDLIPRFTGDTLLGFCDSAQIDSTDALLGDSYKFYFKDLPWSPMNEDFLMEGRKFVENVMSIKNVILNVSAVVFQRAALLRQFDVSREEILSFRVAGDWQLYCLLLGREPGQVLYRDKPNNFHRRHRAGVTHSLDPNLHLQEIRRVQQYVEKTCPLPQQVITAQQGHLRAVSQQLGISA